MFGKITYLYTNQRGVVFRKEKLMMLEREDKNPWSSLLGGVSGLEHCRAGLAPSGVCWKASAPLAVY